MWYVKKSNNFYIIIQYNYSFLVSYNIIRPITIIVYIFCFKIYEYFEIYASMCESAMWRNPRVVDSHFWLKLFIYLEIYSPYKP